jgi:mRNA-degrading endonuclease toxin of MazEF toxin-antitoxin module
VPKPEQGCIIEVQIRDPNQQNVKVRPAVIVSETTEIEAEHRILCVAITGTFPTKLPDDCVLLPYHRQGHPRTGLKKRCVAMCTWLFEIEEADIRKYIGRVPDRQLQEILNYLMEQ